MKVKPLNETPKHTLTQIRKKIVDFYGVKNPDAWYVAKRKSILDKCSVDEFGICKYDSLEAYWTAKQESSRWAA